MKKLRFSKPKFHQYPVFDGGKVVSYVITCSYKTWFVNTTIKTVQEGPKVTGKATCSPNDQYNERLGKMIADSRAKQKAYSIFSSLKSSALLDIEERHLKEQLELIQFYRQMHFLRSSESKHICNLIYGEVDIDKDK